MIGCDSSKSFSTSWHLDELANFAGFAQIVRVKRRRSKFEKLTAKFQTKFTGFNLVPNSIDTLAVFNENMLKGKFFFPHFENRYFINTKYFHDFIEDLREFRQFSKIMNNNEAINDNEMTISSLGIHARISDDGKEIDRSTKIDWLAQAIEKFQSEQKTPNGDIVCFTDTPKKVQALLEYFPHIRIIGQELSPLNSLLELSKFKNLVLADSTFSFWAGEISNADFIISPCSSESLLRPTKQYFHLPKQI